MKFFIPTGKATGIHRSLENFFWYRNMLTLQRYMYNAAPEFVHHCNKKKTKTKNKHTASQL